MKISTGAVVKGGTSLAYHTGTWRDQRPVIDQQACKKCGICHQVCPDDAIQFQAACFSIDYRYCKGCGICAFECPSDAITIIVEEK